MTAIITEKFKLHNATQFYESFAEAAKTVYYMLLGKATPFTAATRMELLEELLKVEKQVKERYKRKLIQSEELFAIQKIWDSSEYGKGFTKTVAEIYKKVYNVELKGNWSEIEVSTQDCEEELTLAEIC